MIRALMLSALVGVSGNSFADEAAAPPAVKGGWVKRAFDFSAPDLDFTALVPEGAKVETTAMKPRPEENSVWIDIIAKVQRVETDDVPFQVRVFAYDLQFPSSPERICDRAQAESEFRQLEGTVLPDQTAATSNAIKYDGERPVEGVMSKCLVRGHKVLAIHFEFDLSKAETEERRNAIQDVAADYAATFTGSMVFKNGRNDGYWGGVKDVPLVITRQSEKVVVKVRVPEIWTPLKNTFDGRVEGKFAVGSGRGAVWFSTLTMEDRPDLETLGTSMFPFVMQGQNGAFGTVLMTDSKVGPDGGPEGPLVRQYRFSIKFWNGEPHGYLHAIAVWHKGVLYILDYWWPSEEDDADAFFNVLPAMTVYDAVLAELENIFPEKSR